MPAAPRFEPDCASGARAAWSCREIDPDRHVVGWPGFAAHVLVDLIPAIVEPIQENDPRGTFPIEIAIEMVEDCVYSAEPRLIRTLRLRDVMKHDISEQLYPVLVCDSEDRSLQRDEVIIG